MGRIAGFDYGRARIGVAISDERQIIASPYGVISAEKNLELTVAIVKKKLESFGKLDLLIIGLPLLLSGKEGDMAREAQSFAKQLSTIMQTPFLLWDERLTSAMAERLMKEDARSRKQRAKSVDTLCATIILQNYLDSKDQKRPPPLFF